VFFVNERPVQTAVREFDNILDGFISPDMNSPAPDPATPAASDATLDPAVNPLLASSSELLDGNQSLPDDVDDPDSWKRDLALLDAQNAQAAQAATTTEATTEQVANDPTAGVAAEGTEEATPGDEKYGPQHRIRPRSETDAAVLKLMSRNQDMTLEEAYAKVKGSSTPAETSQTEEPAPAVAAASALESIAARKAEKEQELLAAFADMDFEKAAKLTIEMNTLNKEELKAEAAAAAAEVEETNRFNAQVAAAEAETVRLYPSSAAANSLLNQRMTAMYEMMKEKNDPLLYQPDMLFRLAQMAAGQLNIGPVVASSSPAPAPAAQAANPPRALTQVRPAAGGQVTGAVTAQPADLSAMDDWSPEKWEAYNESLRRSRVSS
jgi:hypothetical protein